MTLVRDAVMLLSRKQKVNTRSSTETELVVVDDTIGSVLWSLYFMQSQGLDMKCARIYQDNNSAILLEMNGRQSSTKRTKHIKTKYFFVKDTRSIKVKSKSEKGIKRTCGATPTPSQSRVVGSGRIKP